MSFERSHNRPTSHHAADDDARAKPGKHTQVDDHDHGGASAASSSGVNLPTLQAFIGKHEGNVDHVYLDSRGFPTAGIGHLLTGGHFHVGQKVSAAQVTEWFRHDVASAIAGARRQLGAAYERLDEARRIVVIDMVFNLGEAGFGSFHATIHAIKTGNFAQAASNMLQSLWASQVGHRAVENASIMRSGHFAGGGGTQVSAGGGGHGDHGGGHHGDHHGGHHGGHDTEHASGGGGGGALAEVRAGNSLLRHGSRGPAVERIQHLLHVAADGIFGDHTLHAVTRFQRTHHLAADGVVGPLTLAALEHRKQDPKHREHGHGEHGHGNGQDKHDQHDGDHPTGDHGSPHHGDHGDKWAPAPPLEDVKSGVATLHLGEQGGSVRHVQRLLAVETDGKFGPGTRAAVKSFQLEHHMQLHGGVVDAHTLDILTKHPAGSIEGESRDGSAQRHRMLDIARSASGSRRPDGKCYFHVCQFLIQCGGYGRIRNPYTQFPSGALPEAHDFADLMNSTGPARWGLIRLSMSSPYDAPAGAIVVVKAGSPGTHHKTAGDIAIADGHGSFFNGGLMGYSGREGWSASPSAHLLGVYVPR
jgi:peptidoglycan hydrolase-like protein with peptidoglycan-binding domain